MWISLRTAKILVGIVCPPLLYVILNHANYFIRNVTISDNVVPGFPVRTSSTPQDASQRRHVEQFCHMLLNYAPRHKDLCGE